MQWDSERYLRQHGFVIERGQALVELLDPRSGERILDLACGTGDITQTIAERGARVVGVDSSPEMIAAARQRFPGLDFRVEDAAALPFDGEFDAVFSHAALHWVKRAEDAIRGMRRALKPGGRLIAEFGGWGNVSVLEEAFARALRDVAGRNYVSPWYFPRLGEYAVRLETNGLLVRAAWHFDRPTPLQGEDGLRQWLLQFLPRHLADLDDDGPGQSTRDAVMAATEANARDALLRDGVWYADYRRLRIVAEAAPAG